MVRSRQHCNYLFNGLCPRGRLKMITQPRILRWHTHRDACIVRGYTAFFFLVSCFARCLFCLRRLSYICQLALLPLPVLHEVPLQNRRACYPSPAILVLPMDAPDALAMLVFAHRHQERSNEGYSIAWSYCQTIHGHIAKPSTVPLKFLLEDVSSGNFVASWLQLAFCLPHA